MQGLSTRGLGSVFAAGFGGSYLYNNSDQIAKSLFRSIAESTAAVSSNGKSRDSGTNYAAVTEVASQVDALSRQIDRLALASESSLRAGGGDRVVVVGGATTGSYAKYSLSNVLAGLLSASGALAALYLYARMKGFSRDDLVWVTKSTFQQSVQAMRTMASKLSSAMNSLRSELNARILGVERKLAESHNLLMDKIGTDVGRTTERVDSVSLEVAAVQRLVEEVQSQLHDLHGRMRYANHGIFLLCQVVAQLPETYGSASGEELKHFAALQPEKLSEKIASSQTFEQIASQPTRPHRRDEFDLDTKQQSEISGLGSLLFDSSKYSGREVRNKPSAAW
mmetsp:Transcript_11468/g.20743  ORF Transcript_11468/g.20743 Transcript_11468/m.20743 type:complete len:337 (-) Transcript_11468:815-1825(-)